MGRRSNDNSRLTREINNVLDGAESSSSSSSPSPYSTPSSSTSLSPVESVRKVVMTTGALVATVMNSGINEDHYSPPSEREEIPGKKNSFSWCISCEKKPVYPRKTR